MKIPQIRGTDLTALTTWAKELSTELQREFAVTDNTQRWGKIVVDFGAAPVVSASVSVYKQTDLASSDVVLVGVEAVASADHTAAAHKAHQFHFATENTLARSHFTIFVTSAVATTGKWNLIWARR